MSIVIAIDGPAASGKSSTARAVAEALGYAHLDSGALYRGLTLAGLREGEEWGISSPLLLGNDVVLEGAERRQLTLKPEGQLFIPWMDNASIEEEIRSLPVTTYVSRLSAAPEIRDWVNAKLRAVVKEGRDVVVDGRDIGSVVFPDAKLKVFLTASPEVRAQRRISQRGIKVDANRLAREIAAITARDEADSTRPVAPLRRAPDAVELDTTDLTFEEQVARIVGLASGS